MNKFETLLGLGAVTVFFPLALIGVALALVPLAIIGAVFITGVLAEAVALRKISVPAAARQSGHAE